MTHFYVATPPLFYDYGYDEPPEEFPDWVYVDAPNPRRAKVLAVQELRAKKSKWIEDGVSRKVRANPFRGLTVSIPTCEHGFCWCDICSDDPTWSECPACMAEMEAEVPGL